MKIPRVIEVILESLSRDVLVEILSIALPSYSTFVAILFTLAVVHFKSKYGYISSRVLTRKFRGILAVYCALVLMSVFFVLLSLDESIVPALVILEIVAIVLSLPYFLFHLWRILALTPLDIAKDLGLPGKPSVLHQNGKVFECRDVIIQCFGLLRACIVDPTMQGLAERLSSLLSDTIGGINWEKYVIEKRPHGSVDNFTLLLNIVWFFQTHFVEPIRVTYPKPNYVFVRQFVGTIMRAFLRSGYVSSSMFDDYLNRACRLIR